MNVACEVFISWTRPQDEGSLIDIMFLTNKRLLDIDDFIENLWKIHVQVKSEGYVQVHQSQTSHYYIDSSLTQRSPSS